MHVHVTPSNLPCYYITGENAADAVDKFLTESVLPRVAAPSDEFRVKYFYHKEMDEFLAENYVMVCQEYRFSIFLSLTAIAEAARNIRSLYRKVLQTRRTQRHVDYGALRSIVSAVTLRRNISCSYCTVVKRTGFSTNSFICERSKGRLSNR